jgi:hypothetical protein
MIRIEYVLPSLLFMMCACYHTRLRTATRSAGVCVGGLQSALHPLSPAWQHQELPALPLLLLSATTYW